MRHQHPTDKQYNIIRDRYNPAAIQYIQYSAEKRTPQWSGLFALATATEIILEKTLPNCQPKIDKQMGALRIHFRNMLKTKQILRFPREKDDDGSYDDKEEGSECIGPNEPAECGCGD